MLDPEAHPVAEGHLAGGMQHSVCVKRVCAQDSAIAYILAQRAKLPDHRFIIRKIIGIPLHVNQDKLAPCFLQLRADDMRGLVRAHRKGHKGRRHIDPAEGAAHGVLAADRSQSQRLLRAVRAEQRTQRLTPPLRILRHPAEVLLERKMNPGPVTAGSGNLRGRVNNCPRGAVERTPGGQIRVKSVRHQRSGIALSLQRRNLGCHHLRRGILILSSERHQDSCRADGGIKHLHKALLRAAVQSRQSLKQKVLYLFFRKRLLRKEALSLRHHNPGIRLLVRSVGVQKCTAQVNDRFPSPVHDKTCIVCDNCHRNRLQILLGSKLQKLVRMLRRHDNRHSLLRL